MDFFFLVSFAGYPSGIPVLRGHVDKLASHVCDLCTLVYRKLAELAIPMHEKMFYVGIFIGIFLFIDPVHISGERWGRGRKQEGGKRKER